MKRSTAKKNRTICTSASLSKKYAQRYHKAHHKKKKRKKCRNNYEVIESSLELTLFSEAKNAHHDFDALITSPVSASICA